MNTSQASIKSILLYSILPAAILALAIVTSLYVKPFAGVVVIAIGILAYILWICFYPKYRYWRVATGLLTTHLAIRFSMKFHIVALLVTGPKGNGATALVDIVLANDSGYFDVCVSVLTAILFILDFRTREGNSVSRRILNIFNLQVSSGGGHQIAITNSPNTTINFLAASETTHFNAKIDRAADFIKSGKNDVAVQYLTDLRNTDWDNLSNREKFRVYANLGHATNAKGLHEEAAKWFIEARSFVPDDEQAMGLDAAAYLNLGNSEVALKKALEILKKYPNSELGNAIRIRADRSDESTEVLQNALPEHLKNSIELLYALHERALRRDEIELAISSAEQLRIQAEADLKTRTAGFQGTAVVRKLILSKQGFLNLTVNEFRSNVAQALQLLNQAITDQKLSKNDLATFRYYRAIAHDFDGQTSAAEADFLYCLENEVQDVASTRVHYGMFLANHGKINEALKEFHKVPVEKRIEGTLRLCRILVTYSMKDQFKEAQSKLEEIEKAHLQNLDEDSLFEFASCLGKVYLELYGPESVKAFFARLQSHTHKFSILAARALVYIEIDSSQTRKDSQLALNMPFSAQQRVIRFLLAIGLRRINANAEALRALEPIVSATHCDEPTELALQCALDDDNDEFVLRTCRRLRLSGEVSGNAIQAEVAVLEGLSEFRQAVEVIDQSIDNVIEPQIKDILCLRKSLLGIRTRTPNWVCYDPTKLPKRESASPNIAVNVAMLLARGPKPLDGIDYLYQYIRSNFNTPEPQSCYCSLLALGKSGRLGLPHFETVETGCAVQFKLSDEQLRWIIIEDFGIPKVELGEHSSNSSLSKALKGKKVGETFLIQDDPIQQQTGTITKILDKYSYRALDILESWKTRFPDHIFIRSFTIPKLPSGEPDIQQFIADLEKAYSHESSIQEIMRETPLSATHYARLTNATIVESIASLGYQEEIPIRCCRGTSEEFDQSQRSLLSTKSILIEASSLVTLYFSGVYKSFKDLRFELLITEGTLNLFKALLDENNSRVFCERFLAKTQQGLRFLERKPEEIEASLNDLNAFCNWLTEACRLVGGEAQTLVRRELRDQAEFLFGKLTVESLAVALQQKCTLWTDDYAIAEQFVQMGGRHRTWTDATCSFLSDQNLIHQDSLEELKLFLLDYGYLFTRINTSVIKKCVKGSDFDTDLRPCASLLRYIWASGVLPTGVATVVTNMLELCVGSHVLTHKREGAIGNIVAAVAKRQDAKEVLANIRNIELPCFNSFPWAKLLFQARVDQHLAILLQGGGLILPGDSNYRM